MSWLHTWTPEDVVNADDPCDAFAQYCQQILGVPWPTQKDMGLLRKKVKDAFDHEERLTWYSLCRVAAWMRARKKRPSRVWLVVDNVRDCWSGGGLPELDPSEARDSNVEDAIAAILETEEDPSWRRRLIGARGVVARQLALEEWTGDHPAPVFQPTVDERRTKKRVTGPKPPKVQTLF